MPSPKTLLARNLRRHSTDAERHLWKHLRRRQLGGYRFRRQVPIGTYVADFACLERSLVIELDGSQHAEREVAHDRARDDYLERRGFRVLRFWNNDVSHRLDDVIDTIWSELEPSPKRSWGRCPKGGGGPNVISVTKTTSSPLRPFGAPPHCVGRRNYGILIMETTSGPPPPQVLRRKASKHRNGHLPHCVGEGDHQAFTSR
ncbi:MAG TPA: endonuclease domain-containing protein [Vineibacter sp.]|nr:endonuclease domain-containing protein [Vineibacter sp.]